MNIKELFDIFMNVILDCTCMCLIDETSCSINQICTAFMVVRCNGIELDDGVYTVKFTDNWDDIISPYDLLYLHEFEFK